MASDAYAALEQNSSLAERVGGLVGTDRVRAPEGIEAVCAGIIVEPANAEEVAAIVRFCETDRVALAPLGAGRTLSQIRRVPVAIGVSLSRMAKIVDCEPGDMTVVAEAGITIGALNATLAQYGQRLPVDPCNPGATSIGSLIGAAHAGPLRLSEGTARDLTIGIRIVGHDGTIVRGGGRVVKNVAGYDLMKVVGGAFGTLGIAIEAAFKVRPSPPAYGLEVVRFDDAKAAFEAAHALNEALPLAHLEVMSPPFGERLGSGTGFVLAAGFSGIQDEVDHFAKRIRGITGGGKALEAADAQSGYERLRDLHSNRAPLAARIAVPPARLSDAIQRCSAAFVAHAGSGVADISLDQLVGDRDHVARWREIANSAGGHLRILGAVPSIRGEVDFFDTPNPGALKLMRRLKATFDPAGIFNPGCFVGGI